MAHQTVGYTDEGMLESCRGPVVEPSPSCPVEITLAALRGRWTPLVIQQFLRVGERSFTDLASGLPTLSDKVLSDRLAQLTAAGIVERRRTPGWPPRVAYRMTERGRALLPVLQVMWDWGAENG